MEEFIDKYYHRYNREEIQEATDRIEEICRAQKISIEKLCCITATILWKAFRNNPI